MNLRPLGDRVIVLRDTPEEITASGIVLTSSGKEPPDRGVVMAVGAKVSCTVTAHSIGMSSADQNIKVGDRVLFNRYAGATVKHEGKELLILTESEVLAVVGNASA